MTMMMKEYEQQVFLRKERDREMLSSAVVSTKATAAGDDRKGDDDDGGRGDEWKPACLSRLAAKDGIINEMMGI